MWQLDTLDWTMFSFLLYLIKMYNTLSYYDIYIEFCTNCYIFKMGRQTNRGAENQVNEINLEKIIIFQYRDA